MNEGRHPTSSTGVVGQVMKATQGQAKPQLVNKVLKRKLAG